MLTAARGEGIRDRDPAACREKAPHGDLLFPRLVNK
jgi:hypothetical protein